MNNQPEPSTGDDDLQDNTTEDTDYSTGATDGWLLLGLFWLLVAIFGCFICATLVMR